MEENAQTSQEGLLTDQASYLKTLRTSLGITQAHLAHELGISQSYYSALELGARPLTKDLMGDLLELETPKGRRMIAKEKGFSEEENNIDPYKRLALKEYELEYLIYCLNTGQRHYITVDIKARAIAEADNLVRHMRRLEEGVIIRLYAIHSVTPFAVAKTRSGKEGKP